MHTIMVVLQCVQVAWPFETLIRFPAVKKQLFLGSESEEESIYRNVKNAIDGAIGFSKKWRAKILQSGSEFDSFNPG